MLDDYVTDHIRVLNFFIDIALLLLKGILIFRSSHSNGLKTLANNLSKHFACFQIKGRGKRNFKQGLNPSSYPHLNKYNYTEQKDRQMVGKWLYHEIFV
jgi:hypothetical protein